MAITKVNKKKASTVEIETVDVVNEETENIDAEVVSTVEAETVNAEVAATAEIETAEAEAEAATVVEAVEAETVTESEETEIVAYCGPTIKGVAKRNTIYKGLPKALSDYVEEHKYVKTLIVPVSQFGKTLEKLKNRQSAESKIYNKILKTL